MGRTILILPSWAGTVVSVVAFLIPACGEMPAPPPPQQAAAVAPVYPGRPPPPAMAGPLQIAALQSNPNPVPIRTWTEGYVVVYFNGAATRPGRVTLTGQKPGNGFFETLGSESFVSGQTNVRVKFGLFGDSAAKGPMQVRATIAGQGDAAGYSGTVNFIKQ